MMRLFVAIDVSEEIRHRLAEIQDQLDSAQRWLLALDDPLNDELSSAGAGRSGFLK